MAHVKTQYGRLWKPEIDDNVDPQKMFIENIGQEEDNYKNVVGRVLGVVQSIPELRTVSVGDETLYKNGAIIIVNGVGAFYLIRDGIGTDDGTTIIKPSGGIGRWFAIYRNKHEIDIRKNISVPKSSFINNIASVPVSGITANDIIKVFWSKQSIPTAEKAHIIVESATNMIVCTANKIPLDDMTIETLEVTK